jgi:hypothetical protein
LAEHDPASSPRRRAADCVADEKLGCAPNDRGWLRQQVRIVS